MNENKNKWSVFENCHLIECEGVYQWITEFNFYMGDLSNVDTSNDWRFKEIKNKRKMSKFLGVVETTFPIQYPLTLNNGIIISKDHT